MQNCGMAPSFVTWAERTFEHTKGQNLGEDLFLYIFLWSSPNFGSKTLILSGKTLLFVFIIFKFLPSPFENSAYATARDTLDVTHLVKEEVFTAAKVATAIKGIKSGKAAGEDEIRPEMLKALTREGIVWLTRVCQVAWKFGKTPRDWQTDVIIPIFKKGDR